MYLKKQFIQTSNFKATFKCKILIIQNQNMQNNALIFDYKQKVVQGFNFKVNSIRQLDRKYSSISIKFKRLVKIQKCKNV